jgi:two-component system, NtrC family, nitrogen regulation response regulator GlnG
MRVSRNGVLFAAAPNPMAATSGNIHKILVVDPEEEFLEWAKRHLATRDIVVEGLSDAAAALAWAKQNRPSVVLAELMLEPYSGLDLLKKLRLEDPNALVVLTTGAPPTSVLIEAMKIGSYDFLRKSALAYELRPVIESAVQAHEALVAQKAALPRSSGDVETASETMIGESSAMQDVFKLIGRVSRSDAPVLITGESGCGKEVVARAVHHFSNRSAKQFVGINCAAIPESLLESELFGHEKGSFTGAMQQRIGRFEQCDGGTLFLDEIGEMPVLIQSKLLRVLQEGEFSRVGGNQTLRTNVRIIAATNRQPEKAIEAGTFREDLFYRLNVVRIHLPPLRERIEDIRPLAEFFLRRISKQRPGRPLQFSEGALMLLESYNWPGNVRELENVVQRAAVLATGTILMPKDIPLGMDGGSDDSATGNPFTTGDLGAVLDHLLEEAEAGGKKVLSSLEDAAIARAMARCGGDVGKAAALLGLTKAALGKRLPSGKA